MSSAKKYIGLVVFDVLTFGIPLYVRNLYRRPKETLKISAVVLPIILLFLWIILPW